MAVLAGIISLGKWTKSDKQMSHCHITLSESIHNSSWYTSSTVSRSQVRRVLLTADLWRVWQTAFIFTLDSVILSLTTCFHPTSSWYLFTPSTTLESINTLVKVRSWFRNGGLTASILESRYVDILSPLARIKIYKLYYPVMDDFTSHHFILPSTQWLKNLNPSLRTLPLGSE